MSRSALKAKKARLRDEDVFHCRFLQRDIEVASCMNNYVNANALNVRNSPCFKCPVGLKMRAEYAGV